MMSDPGVLATYLKPPCISDVSFAKLKDHEQGRMREMEREKGREREETAEKEQGKRKREEAVGDKPEE